MASLGIEEVRGKPALLSSVLSVRLLPIIQTWISAKSDSSSCCVGKISAAITLQLSKSSGC